MHVWYKFFWAWVILNSGFLYGQGLMVNEFSNGSGGFQEYIELVVVPDPNNPCACVDIGGWIIDDNNGDFKGSGSGKGIAGGHFRFKSGSLPCLAPGTIILIYNADERFASIPPDDITDSNHDQVYILPHTASCIEVCASFPTTTLPSYSGCTYVSTTLTGTTSWAVMGLANSGDACQVRKPNAVFFHGFSYGDVTAPYPTLNSQFGGTLSFNIASGTGSNASYVYDCGGMTTAHWSKILASAGTPGTANSIGNQAFINNLKLGLVDWTNLANPQNCSLVIPSIFAGNDTTICAGNSVPLHATANFNANILWSSNGNGTFSSNNQFNTLYTPNSNDINSGTVEIYIQTIGCQPIKDTLVLYISAPPSLATISDTSICSGNSVILQAWAPASSQLDWYDTATGGNLLQMNQTTFTTPILTATTSYYIETTVNGCTSARKQVTVHITTPPSLATISDTSICSGNSVVLQALAPASSQLDWYDAATGGNLLQMNQTTFTTPILTATTSYYIETIMNGCTSARKQVTVHITTPPSLATISDTSICSGNSVVLQASAPASSQLDWYDAATGGNLLQMNQTTFTTPILTATTSYYIETIMNGCTSARKQVTVHITTPPSLATISDTSVCSGNSVVLQASAPASSQLDWYDAATGGNLLQMNQTTFTTPILTATTSYYIETIMNGCTSARKQVTVQVFNLPMASFSTVISPVCEGSLIPINGTPGATVSYTQNGVAHTLVLDASGQTQLIALAPSPAEWILQSVSNGQCSTLLQDTLRFSITLLDAHIQLSKDEVCIGEMTTLTCIGTPQAEVLIYINGLPDTLLLDASGQIQIPITGTDSTFITLSEIKMNGCSINLSLLDTLIVHPIPTVPPLNFPPICSGQFATLHIPTDSISTVYWYAQATDLTPIFIGSTFHTPILTDTTDYYIEIEANHCISARVKWEQIVLPKGTANFSVSPSTGVFPLTVSIQNQSVQANEYQWIILGDTLYTPNPTSFTWNQSGTYTIKLIINASTCPDTSTQTVIVLNPEEYLYIPNVFTPNQDGSNDYFSVTHTGITELKVQIFDRWGVSIYSGDHADFRWNGTKNGQNCPEGVYVYIIEAQTATGKSVHRAGSISLLR